MFPSTDVSSVCLVYMLPTMQCAVYAAIVQQLHTHVGAAASWQDFHCCCEALYAHSSGFEFLRKTGDGSSNVSLWTNTVQGGLSAVLQAQSFD